MKFEEEILKALRETNAKDPKKLWLLVSDIDFFIREIPSYDEIQAVLKALIENGEIKESSKLHYYKTQKSEMKGTFTAFSEEEYRNVVEYFREWLADEMESVDDIPMEEVIVIRLSQKDCNNKDLLIDFGLLSDEMIQINCTGVPVGVSHGQNSPVIELSTIDSIDPQELYEYILPSIQELIKEHGGIVEVSVGRKGKSKKVYSVNN